MEFSKAVFKAMADMSRVRSAAITDLTVRVKYLSGSGKTEQVATLFFNSAKKCTAIQGAYKSANLPKIFADNIEKYWRNNG